MSSVNMYLAGSVCSMLIYSYNIACIPCCHKEFLTSSLDASQLAPPRN